MSNLDTVKEQLSDLISSGEFNNKSSEELSDILYNLSLALSTNSKSLKNCIGIRILSLNEYNKYIENGTLDGSITKYDERVWHINIPHNLYIIGLRPNDEYLITSSSYGLQYYWDNKTNPPLGKNSYKIFYKLWGWSGEESLRTIAMYDYHIEYLMNNINNKNALIGANNRIRICLGYTTGVFTFGTIYSIDNMNKNSTVYLSPQMQTSVYGSTKVYYRQISFPTGFRPCFSIIDNNKSANLFS